MELEIQTEYKTPESYIGSTVRDVVTGFEGVCTMYSVHMAGWTKLCLEWFNPEGKSFIEHWQYIQFVDIVPDAKSVGFKK